MKTSHFEERIAFGAVETAQRCNESTQRELATFDHDFGGAWLVPPADCARTGHPPGDGGQVSAAGDFKTGHFDPRLNGRTAESLPAVAATDNYGKMTLVVSIRAPVTRPGRPRIGNQVAQGA